MSTAILHTTRGDAQVLTGRLSLAREGAWTAHLELGEDAVPAGAVTLELAREGASPVLFAGTVDHGDTWQGRQKLFVVGGAGAFGITNPVLLPYREWIAGAVPVSAQELVRNVVGLAGEQLADPTLAALAGFGFSRWLRLEGAPASGALTRIVRAVGLTWRTLDTGLVWIGDETWPAAPSSALTFPFPADRDGDALVDVAAPDAVLRPGMTIGGRRCYRVTYTIGADGAPRAELLYRSDRDDFAAAVASVARPHPLSLTYEATVRGQRADGTLDLDVASPTVLELRAVRYRSFSGSLEQVPVGGRVLVSFLGGREDGAIAWGLAQDPAASEPLSLVGDSVDCGQISIAGGQLTYTSPTYTRGVEVFGGATVSGMGPFPLSGVITGPGHAFTKGRQGS